MDPLSCAGINYAAERSYNTLFSNSTLLPLLLLSLARQKHSPDTSKKIRKSYDYIVVGAGASGSVVASRLSEIPSVNVLLLEAGHSPPRLTAVPGLTGTFFFTDLDWQYKTTPQMHTGRGLVNRQLPFFAGKMLGGSTTLSAGLHVRGNRKDYDDWAEKGAKGWSYNEVLPYFKRLEDNVEPDLLANGYHGAGGPITVMRPRYAPEIQNPIIQSAKCMGYRLVDPNAEKQTGFFYPQMNLRDSQRCSSAKAYLVPVEHRNNLDIVTNAFVTKIIIENKQSVGVLFDIKRRTFRVRANREVIVSAGAINTAQLLLLSGIGPKEELEKLHIPVLADLPVGRNFQDHPGSSVHFTLSPPIKPLRDKFLNPDSLREYINHRSGPLATAAGIVFNAFLGSDGTTLGQDFPKFEIYLLEGFEGGLQKLRNFKPEVFQQVFEPYSNNASFVCSVQLLHPKSRGTVKLQSSNPYDPPLLNPNYLADLKDVDGIVEGLKACKSIGESYHMRKVGAKLFQSLYPGCEKYGADDDAYFRCQVRSVVYTFWRACGTAKLGDPRDPTTVVDPELRVKHIRGLRVVDASIMPSLPSGNTGVPAMMIAEKAADMIKSTIDYADILLPPMNDKKVGNIEHGIELKYDRAVYSDFASPGTHGTRTSYRHGDGIPVFQEKRIR